MRFLRSRISELGLWPRMALAISVGFIALFLTLGLLFERVLQDDAERLREQRLIIAKAAAGQIDSVIDQAISSLEQFVRRSELESKLVELSDLAKFVEDERELQIFPAGLVLLDHNGRSISSRPPSLYPPGTDMSGLTHVARALELDRVSMSEPFQDPSGGQNVVAISVPVHEDGQLVGILCGFISLSSDRIIGPLRAATALSESEHAVIVDGQGRVVFSTFLLPLLSPGEHHSFYLRAMADRIPVVETVPFELELPGEPFGHLHVMAFAPLANAPWGVSVGGDEADIFSGIQRLRWGLAAIGIAALVAVWTLTLIGARRLARPVQQLTLAADQIAAGKLDIPLQIQEGGEIGVLAMALERMRNQLLADIEELSELNSILEERVFEQTEDLRRQQALTQQLLQELIDAQEGERTRLARELHDDIGQVLTAVEFSLGHLANAIPSEEVEARLRLEESRALTEQAVADLRSTIAALRPGALDQLGLVPALEWIGDHMLRKAGISVSVNAEGLDHRLSNEVETTLFRIAQEAMNNVGRHSQATSLTINLRAGPDEVTMILRDNGQGITSDVRGAYREEGQNLGIAGMQERAALAGGKLSIESVPNEGTEVRVTLPIISDSEEGEIMAGQPIKLIIVDDHAIMREGLAKLLADESDLEIVGVASDGREAVDLALNEPVDVILLDIVMGDMTGLEAAREILSDRPDIKVIMLTVYEEEAFLRKAFQVGASGYFLKGSDSRELISTIRNVYEGGTYLSPKMAVTLDDESSESRE